MTKAFICYFEYRYAYRYYNTLNEFKASIVVKIYIFHFFKFFFDNNLDLYAQFLFKIEYFFNSIIN